MMKKFVIGLVLMMSFIALTAQDKKMKTFNDFEEIVNNLEKDEYYTQAIKLTKSVWDMYPENEFELFKELEYLNEKTGQYEENLELWKSAHKKGYFFLLHKQIKKFEPYLEFALFDSLTQEDMRLRNAAIAKAKTIYHIEKPEDYDPAKKYTLLMILHGGGSNMEEVKGRWQLFSEIKSKYIVAFFQSYRHYDSKTFGWRSSDERTFKEMRECFNEIKANYSVDTLHVIMGGTSAGGTMALDLAFNEVIPVSGIIGFCPGLPRDISVDKIKNTDLRIYMLGGENDFYLPIQKQLAQMLDELKMQYIHKIIPGMGHDFPENYEQYMKEALLFLE